MTLYDALIFTEGKKFLVFYGVICILHTFIIHCIFQMKAIEICNWLHQSLENKMKNRLKQKKTIIVKLND